MNCFKLLNIYPSGPKAGKGKARKGRSRRRKNKRKQHLRRPRSLQLRQT